MDGATASSDLAHIHRRFTVVDGLRGIAALSVVLFHAVTAGHVDAVFRLFPTWTKDIFLLGENGVAIFFVLSGFVIAHSLFRKRMSGGDFVRFTLKRSARLDPPYWVSILVAIGFAYLSSRIVSDKGMPQYTLGQIEAHLFYLQDLLGYPAIGTVYWTLCLEIQFYLLYALMVMSADFMALFFAAACIASALWPLHLAPNVWTGLFLPLWHTFLLGAVSYWAWKRPKVAPLFFLFASVTLSAGLFYGERFTVVAAMVSLLLYLCAVRDALSWGLNWRWLQFLGLISYSLYLSHNIVTGAVFRVGKIVSPPGASAELACWIVSVAACVATAALLWWTVERPSLRLSAWLGRKQPREVSDGLSPGMLPTPESRAVLTVANAGKSISRDS